MVACLCFDFTCFDYAFGVHLGFVVLFCFDVFYCLLSCLNALFDFVFGCVC